MWARGPPLSSAIWGHVHLLPLPGYGRMIYSLGSTPTPLWVSVVCVRPRLLLQVDMWPRAGWSTGAGSRRQACSVLAGELSVQTTQEENFVLRVQMLQAPSPGQKLQAQGESGNHGGVYKPHFIQEESKRVD